VSDRYWKRSHVIYTESSQGAWAFARRGDPQQASFELDDLEVVVWDDWRDAQLLHGHRAPEPPIVRRHSGVEYSRLGRTLAPLLYEDDDLILTVGVEPSAAG